MALAATPAAAQSLNPDVSAATAAHTICISGCSKHARPGSAWLRRLKQSMLAAIGEPPEAAHRLLDGRDVGRCMVAPDTAFVIAEHRPLPSDADEENQPRRPRPRF